ncbi:MULTISPECIES: CbrC family protein [Gilliamella]|nr:CbrC family protein [Gilliamella sp. W8129]
METQKFAGSFNDYISVEVIPKDKLDEVLYRTPNYISWQQQVMSLLN